MTSQLMRSIISFALQLNKVKYELRKKRSLHEKQIADQAKSNPKFFWSHVKRKLKTKVGVSPLLSDVTDRNSICYDDFQKACNLRKITQNT